MPPSQATETDIAVEISNLGGISGTTVNLCSGVNVLAGRNATNRTSFLRAVMGALGSDRVSLKADADVGRVELSIADETYHRQLRRQNGTVLIDGDPYLDDPTLADLFAFLLESNEARQAVSRSDDLRELIMRPVDVDAINAEIEEVKREKRRLDSRLADLDGLADDLPDLEAERTRLADQIEATRAELADKRETLAEMDGSVEASRQDKQELDAALSELQSVQSTIEETRFQLETERESRETLRSELKALSAERDSLSEPADTVEDIDATLDSLRKQRATLDAVASQLQSVIKFNEEMLAGTNSEVAEALQSLHESETTETDTESPTRQLLADDHIVCWTCGSHVEPAQIEGTIERLRTLRREKLSERSDVRDEISALTEQQNKRKRAHRQQAKLNRRIERAETELDDRAARIESLETELSELRERATELESTVDALDSDRENAVLDAHKAVTECEFELSQHESAKAEIEAKIEEIENELAERERLKNERGAVSEQLTELRTRIEQLEEESIEAFNTHMDNVLSALGYDNLERIWIERTTEEQREGRRLVDQSVFTLHIVRTGPDGATYEDTIDHLSESEREVTGLVFALAGYLVHEVYEEVPIMVLDSLEAIDSNRIARLVDYFSEYAETILVALLPEDAAALDDEYSRVTEI